MLNEFNGLNPGEIMVYIAAKRLFHSAERMGHLTKDGTEFWYMLTVGEIAYEAICMPRRTASRHLNSLVKKGKLRRWHFNNHRIYYRDSDSRANLAQAG
jgi:hypothetical protein